VTGPYAEGSSPAGAPVTTYVYDVVERLGSITAPDPDGSGPLKSAVTVFGYYATGWLKSQTDPENVQNNPPDGRPTVFEYDRTGWLLLTKRAYDVISGTQSVTAREYNGLGQLVAVTDPNLNVSRYGYDRLGRLFTSTETDGVLAGDVERQLVTMFTYDREDRTRTVRDASGNTTEFLYDALGRIRQQRDPLGRLSSFSYDAASNLKSITDRRGWVRQFDYDLADRLTSEQWVRPNGAQLQTVRTLDYTYDDANQLKLASDPSSSRLALAYDNAGRTTTVDNASTPNVPNVVLTSSYDVAGRRTRLANTMPGAPAGTPVAATAGFLSYAYDAAGRMTRIQDGTFSGGVDLFKKRVDFTYNQRDQYATIKRYQNTATGTNQVWSLVTQASMTYDDLGRLRDLHHKGPTGATQDRFQISYDPGDRITQVTTTPTGASLSPFTTTFGYDKTDQLKTVASSVAAESYGYDATGNRTTSSVGADSRSYATGAAPHANRVTSDGKHAYTFDLEGNLIQKTLLVNGSATGETLFFTWDHRNRLVSVERRPSPQSPASSATLLVTYAYDVFDRRIAKTVDADGAGSAVAYRESYVYDGPHILLEFFDPDASGPQPSRLQSRRLYGPAVDQILAEDQFATNGTSTTYYPLTDWLGSVRDLVNSSGQVQKHIDHDSFGNVARVTNGSGLPQSLDSSPQSRLGFTAREFDKETGLLYYRARYYDAAIGRFLSEDPIGFGGGDANLYRYVENEPANWVDPQGTDKEKPSVGTDERQRPKETEVPVMGRRGFTDENGVTHQTFCASCHRPNPASVGNLNGARTKLGRLDVVGMQELGFSQEEINAQATRLMIIDRIPGFEGTANYSMGEGFSLRMKPQSAAEAEEQGVIGVCEYITTVGSFYICGMINANGPRLTDQQALRQGIKVRYAKVKACDLKGARPSPTGQTGHAYGKHDFSDEQVANIINNAERKFVGVSPSGRPVNIFVKGEDVVITEGDDITRIITAHGTGGINKLPGGKVVPGRPVDVKKFENNPSVHEVK
jgi:RHS repeat-associated protein